MKTAIIAVALAGLWIRAEAAEGCRPPQAWQADWWVTDGEIVLTPWSLPTEAAFELEGISAIYHFDGEWSRYVSGAPEYVQTLAQFETGEMYWLICKEG